MTITVPKPVAQDDKTVTFDRGEFEAFLEDIAGRQAFDRFHRHVQNVGMEEVIRLSYTAAEVNRMLDDGVSAVTIWREREGLTQRELATAAAISQSYLAEIESGNPDRAFGAERIERSGRLDMEKAEDFAMLYRRAFEDIGANALWSSRPVPRS
jgi:hypothetical protein